MTTCPAAARKLIAMAAAAVVAGLLAGCGSSSSPSAQPTATVTVTETVPAAQGTSPAAPTQGATTPGSPAACATTALTASLGPRSGAAGSSYYPIVFKNSSSAPCSLYGYPGVSLVTASSTQVGAAAVQDPTYPRRLVTLARGSIVHAELKITDAGNYPPSTCQPATADRLRIFPPGQTSPLYISLSTVACSNTSVQILSVQTVQPGSE